MSRPTSLLKDTTLYWVLRLYNSSGVLVDADSLPTVSVRKNGSAVGDSVTVTKRSATTGIYDCSYNPAGEVEGDQFTLEETAVISSVTYTHSWEFGITAAERGTDSAYTGTPPTSSEIADAVEGAILNEGDATALLQAIADKISGDLTAGDLTALAIVSAIKADATLAQMITRIDATITSRLPTTSYTAPDSAATIASATAAQITTDHGAGSYVRNTEPDNATISSIDTKLGTPASSVSADIAAVKTDTGNLVSRITANLFAGITSVKNWLGTLAGKTPDATTLAEIKATTAGAGFDNTTDSLQAIRDNGGGGGGGGSSYTLEEIADAVEARLTGVVHLYTNFDSSTQKLTLVAGDDYSLEFSNTAWQDLTGATITFTARGPADTIVLTKACTILSTSRIRLVFTPTETALPIRSDYRYDIKAVWSSTNKRTLLGPESQLVIRQPQTR